MFNLVCKIQIEFRRGQGRSVASIMKKKNVPSVQYRWYWCSSTSRSYLTAVAVSRSRWVTVPDERETSLIVEDYDWRDDTIHDIRHGCRKRTSASQYVSSFTKRVNSVKPARSLCRPLTCPLLPTTGCCCCCCSVAEPSHCGFCRVRAIVSPPSPSFPFWNPI